MKFFVLFLLIPYTCLAVAETSKLRDIERETLLARYRLVFATHATFAEQQVIALEEDTRNYFYDRDADGIEDKDLPLQRLHAKLLLYLNFYQINIKARGRQLSDWNYYRLMLDALRTVDARYLKASSDTAQHYYELLYQSATNYLWRAVRIYQEHFPFLDWGFCSRHQASCPQQESPNSWESIEQVVAVLNVAIDRLNRQVERFNEVAKSRFDAGNANAYQQAVQNYLRTYEELVAKPYGALLLMVSKQQHHKMLSNPAPFSNYTLAKFKPVDVETVEGLFAKLATLFAARAAKLNTLYNSETKKDLQRFLIKYHRQAVAEFLINHPRFFNIINYYLDLVNTTYETTRQRTANIRHSNNFMIAGGVGLSYAALHHFFRFGKGQILYITALVGGAAATTYAALRQKSFVDVFSLRQQVHEMHNSLVLQQSYDLLHFLHQLGQLAQVQSAALLQGGLLTVYSLFFVRHLRKAWLYRHLKKLNHKASPHLLTINDNVNYRGFNLQKISATISTHTELQHLRITERLAIIDDLFGDYPPFREWQKDAGIVNDIDDLTNEQISTLWKISRELQYDVFEPTADHIKEISSLTNNAYDASTIKSDLNTIQYFIHRLFNIDLHRDSIPPAR